MRDKGNADCHIPNDKYREGWDRIFGKDEVSYQFSSAMDNLLGRKEWPGTEYIKRPANVDINVVSE